MGRFTVQRYIPHDKALIAEGAFESALLKVVDLQINGEIYKAWLFAYKIADDGLTVALEFEIPGLTMTDAPIELGFL